MKVHPKIVDRIVEAIKGVETICVVGHVRPDGDCIGSQLGLTLALMNAGKNVTCWNQDPLPAKLAFLDPKKIIRPPEKGQQFASVQHVSSVHEPPIFEAVLRSPVILLRPG